VLLAEFECQDIAGKLIYATKKENRFQRKEGNLLNPGGIGNIR
jgi:hypothetical protein